MTQGGRQRPARGPQDRRLGSCLGWASALLLCVVLAAAGMPARGGAIADPVRIEAGHGHSTKLRAYAVVRHAAVATPGSAAMAAAAPRPRPRSRTIEAGGLPPPRAPTV